MADTPEEIQKHVKGYLRVGYTLFALTVVTWAVSYIDMGSHAANMTVGLGIAVLKAGLVAAIFMHLSSERSLIYKILLFTAFFFVGLMFLSLFEIINPVPIQFDVRH
ncbi:MAG: cytochrome C oxidase subunit IV family protein [Verrucomicrobiales bacterium]